MWTYVKIAWRNVWRNRRRSLLIISTVSVGILGMLASLGFMYGMGQQMLQNAIGSHVGHVEIHRKGFQESQGVKLAIDDWASLLAVVKRQEHIVAYAPRVKGQGLASSSDKSSGAMIVGIDPQLEAHVSTIRDSIIEGDYLSETDTSAILIGKGLADKLKCDIGDKIILMAEDYSGELGSGAYRVKGIYRTASPEFDKAFVFLGIEKCQKLLALGNRISEVVMLVDKPSNLEPVIEALIAQLDPESYEVLNWEEILPLLVLWINLFMNMTYVFFSSVFIAVAVFVVNTLLMAILERMRELGIMRALGTKPTRIFSMIVLESIFLTLVGVIIGTVLGYLLILYLGRTGLDLAVWSDVLSDMGIGSVIYPQLSWVHVGLCVVTALVTAILASLYPATKAVRLKPVEAMRHI